MKISAVDATILRDPDTNEETVLVAVRSDDGVVGYGEAAGRSQAIKAIVESEGDDQGWDDGVRTLLIGQDGTDPAALWKRMRANTFWSCRSGIGHVALAGVDMALWDLAGKTLSVPSWQLMGKVRNEHLNPYVTLYHGAGSFAETLARTLDAADTAIGLGFKAIKVESMPFTAPRARDTIELVEQTRNRVGPDFCMLLDVGYRWNSLEDADAVVQEIDQFGLFALEAPFPPDLISEYRRLADTIATPLASGDQLTALTDYLPLLESETLSYVQGGAARTGVSEMGALASAAETQGIGFIPWGWVPSALATAANVHRSVVHSNIPLIEYRPSQIYHGALRTALAGPEPTLREGEFVVPTAPGLGVDVDLAAVADLRVG